MSDQSSPLSLSREKVNEINRTHIRGTDKWYRMFSNKASRIIKVEEGIIYLSLKYASKYTDIAKSMAQVWLENPNNKILRQADKVVVKEYYTNISPGGAYIGSKKINLDLLEPQENQKSKPSDPDSEKSLITTRTFNVSELLSE